MIPEVWAATQQVVASSDAVFSVTFDKFLYALYTIALAYIAWSVRRGVSQMDETFRDHKACITDLYNKHNKLTADFHELKGEHNARHKSKSSEKRVDDPEDGD